MEDSRDTAPRQKQNCMEGRSTFYWKQRLPQKRKWKEKTRNYSGLGKEKKKMNYIITIYKTCSQASIKI